MNRNQVVQLVAVVGLAGFLAGATLVSPIVAQQRQTYQLSMSSQSNQPVPPQIALGTTAFGVFRGLFVDYLWYRANELKEAGKFYEANQLSQWITTLQPRFPQVWSFHAWNMAYNISVATHTPEERWDWVNKGIALLRDQGIVYNPRAIRLYRELSWIFFHKVGQYSDDMHWYYKRRLAQEWQELLGAPTEGARTAEVIAEFRKVVDAPGTLEELYQQTPAAQALVQKMRDLGYQPGQNLLRKIGQIRMYEPVLGSLPAGARLPGSSEALDSRLVELVLDTQNQPALSALVSHLRKRVLIDDYHMDPARMLDLMERFGPIDWRHPAAHGAYWAAVGTQLVDELKNKKDIDLLNTYRQNIHSLQELTRGGRVSFDPITGHIDMLPDPRFIPAYERAVDTAREHVARLQYGGTTTESYDSGHENFLLQAIVFSYLYGDPDQAREYYDKVRRLYGTKEHNVRSGRYRQTLQDLVLSELTQNIDMMSYTRQFIDSMITNALQTGLANGRLDVFERYVEMARQAHAKFQAKGIANPNAEQDRMRMLPFEEILSESYIKAMELPTASLITRARIWSNTPIPLQQKVYDRLLPKLTEQAQQANIDVARAFPEPPNMAAYRKTAPGGIQGPPAPVGPDAPARIQRQ